MLTGEEQVKHGSVEHSVTSVVVSPLLPISHLIEAAGVEPGKSVSQQVRLRVIVPPPHEELHSLHSPQLAHWKRPPAKESTFTYMLAKTHPNNIQLHRKSPIRVSKTIQPNKKFENCSTTLMHFW